MPRSAVIVSRRGFLGFLVVGGPTLAIGARLGLDGVFRNGASAVGFGIPEVMNDPVDLTDLLLASAAPFAYDLMIEITPENRVRFEVPRAEIGQGVVTAASMMLADNLDVRLADIDASLSPAELRRQTSQTTGYSKSVRSLWDPIRVISAEMRARLVTAGADYLGVPAHTVRTEDTHVVATDGRKVAYGTIAAAAAQVKAPKVAPVPKALGQFKVIGTPHSRIDAQEIVTGRKRYAMDVTVEGALPTVMALPPTAGARFVSVDDAAARAMPGVVAVTPVPGRPDILIGGGVAVTAQTFGQAIKARDALNVTWTEGPMDHMSDKEISELMYSLLEPCNAPATPEGIDAFFEWPYVTNLPMETDDCVADVRADRAELWLGSHVPISTAQTVAETLGFPDEQVTLHVVSAGGSFGRRFYADPAILAAQVSQRIGRPVKLMTTRGDDVRHGRSFPAGVHHVRVSVNGGQITSFEHKVAGPLLDLRYGLLGERTSARHHTADPKGTNEGAPLFLVKVPYAVGVTSISLKVQELAIPTGAFRGNYSVTLGTINEIVISELARKMKRDEYEFRRELLDSDSYRAVLDKVAHEGQWGRPMPAGTAQGFGMWYEYKSIVAYLMECDARGAKPRITRCTIAVDPGRAVNPRGLESTLMGVTMDAISLVFTAALHIDRGAVRETGLADYRWSRMFDSPLDLKVHVLAPTADLPGGAGELGLPAACSAAANAWARATGRNVRRFPINEHGGG
jgi:isoquinoline 1-oxidoreductase beta subunit